MPATSGRVLKGMSIGYATATRGGSHHDTRPMLQYATEHDNTTPEGKPASLNFSQFVARKYWLKCHAALHRLRANLVHIRRVSGRHLPL